MGKKRKIVVIGGGASGMTAAIMAARNGAEVTILEQKDRLGKKILSTGNGKCNYTNANMDVSFFRGEDPSFVSSVPVSYTHLPKQEIVISEQNM